jgi:hypothetical protein
MSRVLLEKLIVAELVNKFLTFGTQRYITVFTTACHWSPVLSQMNTVHTLLSYFSKMHFNIILSSMSRSS